MSKKGRSVSEEMKNSTEPKVAVKSNPAELKQKKNKKSSVKKVVATIEVNVEKKAPKQAGGLKQKKKMKRAPSALKVE